jgi:isopentenyl-diphosphate delta-isomerase
MSSELLWHVDDNDQPIGSVTREEAHRDAAIIHRTVLIVLSLLAENIQDGAEDCFVIQKRAANKDKYPSHWTVAASGHVTYLESYKTAAEREVLEELGLPGVGLTWLGAQLVETPEESQYIGIFKGNIDSIQQLTANTEEISELTSVTAAELTHLLASEKFTPAAYRAFAYIMGS